MVKKGYIYGYFNNKTNACVYIGATFNVSQRHKEHLTTTFKNNQRINKWLQKNPNNFTLLILTNVSSKLNFTNKEFKQMLFSLETHFISKYQPQFNVYKR